MPTRCERSVRLTASASATVRMSSRARSSALTFVAGRFVGRLRGLPRDLVWMVSFMESEYAVSQNIFKCWNKILKIEFGLILTHKNIRL